jgi:hypothetical protein
MMAGPEANKAEGVFDYSPFSLKKWMEIGKGCSGKVARKMIIEGIPS